MLAALKFTTFVCKSAVFFLIYFFTCSLSLFTIDEFSINIVYTGLFSNKYVIQASPHFGAGARGDISSCTNFVMYFVLFLLLCIGNQLSVHWQIAAICMSSALKS